MIMDVDKLLCIGRYTNAPRGLFFQLGDVVEDADVVEFLLRDAPGCFEVAEPAILEPSQEVAVEPKRLGKKK